jgi:hypothetical protein
LDTTKITTAAFSGTTEQSQIKKNPANGTHRHFEKSRISAPLSANRRAGRTTVIQTTPICTDVNGIMIRLTSKYEEQTKNNHRDNELQSKIGGARSHVFVRARTKTKDKAPDLKAARSTTIENHI